MKTFIFLLCTTIFALSPTNIVSQNSKVKIDKDTVLTVDEVFDLIMQQTEYKFFYEEGIFNDFPKVSLKKGTIRTSKLLNRSLSQGNLDVTVTQTNAILIKEKSKNLNSKQQEITVNGLVTDINGIPLAGANIIEKGTSNGIQADFDGNFNISVANQKAILVVSYIGYATKEVTVGSQTTLAITLEEDAAGLDEVVVVGYGTQKKANLTGAVSQINAERLENRPIVNAGQGLQGLIPNLNINFSDGAAGSEATFNIRGFTSLNGGSPLILIDGVIMDPNLLNPNDIESVTVLKDAASAAIYGSRAAFGVILITTKKGKKGQKPRIQYSTSYAINSPTDFPDLVDSKQQLELRDEKQRNLGNPITPGDTRDAILAFHSDPANNPSAFINPNNPESYIYVGNTDWFEEIIGTGSILQNNISMSGSGETISYYASAGWLDQSGILNYGNDSYDRSNLRVKLDIEATDWLQFNISSLYTKTKTNSVYTYAGVGTLWHDLTRKSINVPVRNPDGSWTESPVPLLAEGGRDIRSGSDSWVTLGATLTPLEGLKFVGSYAYNGFNEERKRHKKRVERFTGPSDVTGPRTVHTTPTGLFLNGNTSDYYAINAFGEYEKTFSEDHYFKATLGYNEERKKYHFTNSSNSNLITDAIPNLNLTTGTAQAGEGSTIWAIQGYFGRLNYIYKDKYLVEINGRYDASSRFPDGDRWGLFPSVSLGWRISNESFFEPLKSVFSNLKFRWSYGELGNQSVNDDTINLNNFPYLPTLGGFRPNLLLGGTRPVSVGTPLLVSSSLTWETAISTNYGLDASFLNNRLNLSFDYFEREVVDQLSAAAALPATLGTAAPRANAVESITKGWEIEVAWKDRIGEVNYNIGFNVADAQGEITKFDNPTKSLSNFYVGQKIGQIWGYETNGLFDSAAEYQSSGLDYSNRTSLPIAGGDVWYVDQDGNNIINNGLVTADDPGDLKVIGNSTPRYSYGITLGAEWKGLYLDIFMQGVGKRELALGSNLFYPNEGGTPQISHLNYWTEDNKGAYWPRYLGNQGGFNYATSDRYLQDFSYLRMKQLTIGYNLPESAIAKTFLKSVNVYLTGQNLFEFDNIISGFDPEISENGFNGWGPGKSYPFNRSISLGLNITL